MTRGKVDLPNGLAVLEEETLSRFPKFRFILVYSRDLTMQILEKFVIVPVPNGGVVGW